MESHNPSVVRKVVDKGSEADLKPHLSTAPAEPESSTSKPQVIVLKGLDKVSEMDLKPHLPEKSVETKSSASETQHGELATLIIIAVGVPAIKGLVDWLMKDRTTEEEEKVVEFLDSNGAVLRRETIHSLKKQSTSKDGLIKHIAKTFGIDVLEGF